MVRLTPNGLSVMPRQRAISLVRSSGVGCVSAVMKPSAPALATAETSSARPTHCIPPCTIGCSTPTSSVKRVLIILPSVSATLARLMSGAGWRQARQKSTGPDAGSGSARMQKQGLFLLSGGGLRRSARRFVEGARDVAHADDAGERKVIDHRK